MADRHDKGMAERVAILETNDENQENRIKTMEDRWEEQDKQVLKWLTRALIIMGLGTSAGSSEAIKKKIVEWLPWIGS